MRLDVAEAIAYQLENLGLEEPVVNESYSGRFMYGEVTAALSFDEPNNLIAVGYAAALAEEPAITAEMVTGFHIDELGRGVVVY